MGAPMVRVRSGRTSRAPLGLEKTMRVNQEKVYTTSSDKYAPIFALVDWHTIKYVRLATSMRLDEGALCSAVHVTSGGVKAPLKSSDHSQY